MNNSIVINRKKKLATIITGTVLLLGAIFIIFSAGNLIENVDANKICVIQMPKSGDLFTYSTAGWKSQRFGKTTHYSKAFLWIFDPDMDERYSGLTTRFNDAAEGTIEGSLRVQLPLDHKNIVKLHTYFGNEDGVRSGLILPTVKKCALVTGTLMNSQESLAEKRSQIISWIEDMANKGIYKTVSTETEVRDSFTGQTKIVTTMEIVIGEDGLPSRVEDSKLAEYGVIIDNMSISEIIYGPKVLAQIDRRRSAQMEVDTAIAEALKAEQRAITVEQEGRANAAQAQWEQEVIKSQQVTLARQKLEVAVLDKQAASEERQANILRGQGEAERKRLVMAADGALEPKLETWLEAQKFWAQSAANYTGQWVPTVVMGSNGNTGQINGVHELMGMLAVNQAKQLALDFNMMNNSGTNKKSSDK